MTTSIESLIGDLYKKEWSRLLSVLTRIFGPRNFQLAEDVLQESFAKAFDTWTPETTPSNPSGWIVQVAKRKAIDVIRRRKHTVTLPEDLEVRLKSDYTLGHTIDIEFQEQYIKDDQLRMIFLCCGPHLAPKYQLPLVLKSLCGLSTKAIARALLLSDENAKKRLTRAKADIAKRNFAIPKPEDLMAALDGVHTAIYLLFNEGFHGHHDGANDENAPYQRQLCMEAVGLTELILETPQIVTRDTFSLLALMQYNLARAPSKVNAVGDRIPIDLQDRSLWDRPMIATADRLMQFAPSIVEGFGGRYWIEAQIAQLHCAAPHFGKTDWAKIAVLYHQLSSLSGSPLAVLHEAIARAYAGDVPMALDLVHGLLSEPTLKHSHAPLATLAHLHAMNGDAELAHKFAGEAAEKGGTQKEHSVMRTQIERLLNMQQAR